MPIQYICPSFTIFLIHIYAAYVIADTYGYAGIDDILDCGIGIDDDVLGGGSMLVQAMLSKNIKAVDYLLVHGANWELASSQVHNADKIEKSLMEYRTSKQTTPSPPSPT